MLIVDAQIHLWDSRTGPAHHRAEPLGVDQLVVEMNAAGIDRAINCPALWDPKSNDIAIEAAKRFPDHVATMGWIELRPEGDGEALANWRQQPGMVGLRFVIMESERIAWFNQGKLDWIWAGAQKFGIPVALTAPDCLDTIYLTAQRFPDLKLVVDHMGLGPFGKAPEVFHRLPQLLRLAALPNVAVKATAAPAYASDPYPFRSVHDSLHQIFDAFGPHRMFWGTDITRLSCSWEECKRMFTSELDWLSGDDLAEVMGLALIRWLSWSITESLNERNGSVVVPRTI